MNQVKELIEKLALEMVYHQQEIEKRKTALEALVGLQMEPRDETPVVRKKRIEQPLKEPVRKSNRKSVQWGKVIKDYLMKNGRTSYSQIMGHLDKTYGKNLMTRNSKRVKISLASGIYNKILEHDNNVNLYNRMYWATGMVAHKPVSQIKEETGVSVITPKKKRKPGFKFGTEIREYVGNKGSATKADIFDYLSGKHGPELITKKRKAIEKALIMQVYWKTLKDQPNKENRDLTMFYPGK